MSSEKYGKFCVVIPYKDLVRREEAFGRGTFQAYMFFFFNMFYNIVLAVYSDEKSVLFGIIVYKLANITKLVLCIFQGSQRVLRLIQFGLSRHGCSWTTVSMAKVPQHYSAYAKPTDKKLVLSASLH